MIVRLLIAGSLLNLCLLCQCVVSLGADEPIFSGPQAGERLPGFKAKIALGDKAGDEIDLPATAGDGPALLIFVHKMTRPSIGLTRAIADYAARQKGVTAGVVFLTDDATDTQNWLNRASHAMPSKTPIVISPDGIEGPGAYGLNRNVTLTILVAKEGKVTSNFALVQPSIQADALKISAAVAKLVDAKPPTLADLNAGPAMRQQTRPAAAASDDLRALLRPLIQKQATKAEVDKAAAAIEARQKEQPAVAKQISEIAQRIINAGKLENYGTPHAQTYLKKWAAGTDVQAVKNKPKEEAEPTEKE